MTEILNAELLVERRLALGLSQRALAQQLGKSTQVISGLERGLGHERLNLANLSNLAEALGLNPGELLAEVHTESTSRASDEAKAEAALALVGKKLDAADIAQALGWPLAKTNTICRRLREIRSESGVRVHYTGGRWGLSPARGLLSPHEVAALERASTRRDHLTTSQARVLLAVARGEVDSRWCANASNDQNVSLAKLLRLNWVQPCTRGSYQLTPEAAENLGVVPEENRDRKEPPRHRLNTRGTNPVSTSSKGESSEI